MTWLFEQPWTILLLGVVIELAIGIALYVTGRGALLFLMLGFAAVTGGLLLLERWVVTERERVQSALFAAADAVERGDANAVAASISPMRPGLRQQVKSQLQSVRIDSVSIKGDLKITINELVSPPTARAEFHVVIRGSPKRGGASELSVPFWFAVAFQREQGEWLIVDYEERGILAGAR